MKWLRWFIIAALCAATPASAFWQSRDSNYNYSIAPAASYTGPIDIVASPTVWWGLRAASASDRGNKLINVCDALDAHCVDWASDLSTGKLVAQTVGVTDCTVVTTCTIKTFYDRSGASACSGACDATQATIGNRATLTWSCLNGLPCAVFAGGSSQSYTTPVISATSYAQPYTFVALASRTANFTTAQMIISSGYPGVNLNFRQAANTVQMFAGTTGQTVANITDNYFHAFVAMFSGSSSFLYCGGSQGSNCSTGGTSNSISPGTNVIASAGGYPFFISTQFTGNSYLYGNFTEGGVWASGFSPTQADNMIANQYSFWGPF